MELNNVLRTFTLAAALLTTIPSCRMEQVTKKHRTRMQRVLKESVVDTENAQAHPIVEKAGFDDLDKAKKELAPDSQKAKALFAILKARFEKKCG